MKHTVVVGAGQSGLVAAIYARINGNSVTLVESHAVGGKSAAVTEGVFKFDPGPSILILPEIIRQIFRDAGQNPDEYLKIYELPSITKVFQSGRQYVVEPGLEKAIELVQAIAPQDAFNFACHLESLDKVAPAVLKRLEKGPIDSLAHFLHPALLKFSFKLPVRTSFKSLVDSLFQSPFLRAFYYGFPSYGGNSYNVPVPAAFLIPYIMLSTGVWYPVGGISAIPAALEKLARMLGVQFVQGRVIGVQFSGRSIQSLEMQNQQSITGDNFIWAADPFQFDTFLSRPAPHSASFSYFTLQLGLKKPISGLDHHNLIVPDRFASGMQELYNQKRFPSKPILYLNYSYEQDKSHLASAKPNLFCVATSPSVESEWHWEDQQHDVSRTVLNMLDLAGLSASAEDAVLVRRQTPVYFQRHHNNFLGSLYGADESFRKHGAFLRNRKDPQFKNIFFCGGAVNPGAGLPMVTLSGKFAAELV